MSKSHRDFCVYVRGGIAINALVAVSRDVYFPATQTEPAKTIEHLTLVYLDPSAASNTMTGDQLRNSIKTEFDVPPLGDGQVTGWKDIVAEVVAPSEEAQGSGSERYGGSDWTAVGQDVDGFPVPKGSPQDVTTPTVPSPKDPVLANPLPTQTEAIAEAQVADANPGVIVAETGPAYDPDAFYTGEKVRFSESSGNDTTQVYTINGGEVGDGQSPASGWFWRLNEVSGLFASSSLVSTE